MTLMIINSCFVFIFNYFIGTLANSQNWAGNGAPHFVFLTFHNKSGHSFDVNIVASGSNNIPSNGAPFSLISSKNDLKNSVHRAQFVQQFLLMGSENSAGSVRHNGRAGTNDDDDSIALWQATTGQRSEEDGTLGSKAIKARHKSRTCTNSISEYRISDGLFDDSGAALHTVPLPPPVANPSNSSAHLTVCVFGDFSENLYEHTQLDLSRLISQKKCNMNLFIGKIAWERRVRPRVRFNFSPFLMLHSNANSHKHSVFARVPSIFGAVGGNFTETTFFQSTEVGDAAFLQITVEIATVANLADGTLGYEMVAQYFRETMLNELECKLQELHRRTKRPWIVLYMTHPYLVSNDEDKTQWFIMNDTDRFFDILKRYKVDLLTSCGIEGMARILAKEKREMPDAKLPEYVQTTMAQCGGYQSMDITLQNECSFAVLDIRTDKMTFRKMNADDGTELGSGQIERTFEEADDCVPNEEL